MSNKNPDRIEFFSKEDLAGVGYLSKAEYILRSETKSVYDDINDVIELYNIKKYLDNELYLKSWTENDISNFKQKAIEYGRIIGQFMSNINDSNFISFYKQLIYIYTNSFWELINDQKVFKQVSADKIKAILENNPNEIRNILTYKNIVNHYNTTLKEFLFTYPQSAEILLSIYEKRDFLIWREERLYLPKSLTLQDKEEIVSKYIDSENSNLNYLRLITIARNRENFKLSDQTRLKAKKKKEFEVEKMFDEEKNISARTKYEISVSFCKIPGKIKDLCIQNSLIQHFYSFDYIKKQKNDIHSLFLNFIVLFEYLDEQGRINLLSKTSQMDILEKIIGIHSKNEYRECLAFRRNEKTSYTQIYVYNEIINELGNTLEDILQNVFETVFKEKYNFANNAKLSIPSSNISNFEKFRILAPEFESVLKQFKLFVENKEIDFELLQISSTPTSIKDIPSLNADKYIYLNDKNKDLNSCLHRLFSNQSLLTYVHPFKKERYHNLFYLLANEKVNFNDYEEYQKKELIYLIEKEFIFIDKNNFIQIKNLPRVLILMDLYKNEFASFHHYPQVFQVEAKIMETKGMVLFESSLFSKQEQSYFNYYLNKSEFTNGLDLRNSYLHGTQANPEEQEKHEYAYFTYLKLLTLVLLKIEDDLQIYQGIKK